MPTQLLTRPSPAHASPGSAGASSQTPLRRVRAASGLEWMDMLRIAAILAVVVIHSVGYATKQSGTGWHSAWWWGANLLNSACLWCVPVFVMVSGALLLDPARRVSSGAFLKRRAVRIGLPLAFWIAGTCCCAKAAAGTDNAAAAAIRAVLTVRTSA